jgi:branched-chain amino acid transport system ATP-binding protein
VSAALEAEGVAVAYGKVDALQSSSLRVEAGSIVTVIGPNGAGKTSLLGAIMGLHPSRGTLRFGGVALAGTTTEERVALGISLVAERRELFAGLSVEDNLQLGAFHRRREGARRIGADMEQVYAHFPRLKERARQLAGTLSGGERQMLALGRALMAKPRLLLLDEPSLGLAPRVVREIFHIIAELKRAGMSMLLVEQNARAALQVADYGYVLETGSIVLQGTARELADHPRVVATYLGLSASSA